MSCPPITVDQTIAFDAQLAEVREMFAGGPCTIPAIQRALRVGYQQASRLFYGLHPKTGRESDVTILNGDALEMLRTLPSESVQCCVTSPPYWGLRDYGCAGQIGMEATYQEYVSNIVEIFAQVWRVLKSDGTLWLNLGDCYATGAGKVGDCPGGGEQGDRWKGYRGTRPGSPKHADNAMGPMTQANRMPQIGLKPKDLVGIPWRVALALQEAGWYLRSDIIWCLSGGAWVYARTQKGDMPVMVKDLVRLNPSSVKLWNGVKWTQVLGWGASKDTGQRIELVLRSGERIGCTGGHMWPTQRGNVTAGDMVVGDTIKTCLLPEPETNRPPYLSDDLLWLIGLYLAEGSRAGDTVQLSLNSDEIGWLPRIETAASSVGATMTSDVSGNRLSVRLYGRILVAIIEEYIGGKISCDIHLRAVAWRLPNVALRLIADGYLAGDGSDDHPNGRHRLGFARNYSLERDLRTLAARLGATLTLTPCVAKYQSGEKPAFRGEWRWERSGHHNEKDRGEVVSIRSSRARQFWDIAVEDEPHLFALASGVLTHNCKPNPMPESVTDRPTKSHEYIFLLTKSDRYYYDHEAIKEPAECGRLRGSGPMTKAGTGRNDTTQTGDHRVRPSKKKGEFNGKTEAMADTGQNAFRAITDTRNKRSVWTVQTFSYPEAHFATYPPDLIKPCIMAGTKPGDVVLDPFGGSGTTGAVALELGRRACLIELNPDYVKLIERRCTVTKGLGL